MSKKPFVNAIISLSCTLIVLIIALILQGWLYVILGFLSLVLYILELVLISKPEQRTAGLILGLIGGVLSLVSGICAFIAAAIVEANAPSYVGLFIGLALLALVGFILALVGFIVGMKERSIVTAPLSPTPTVEESSLDNLSQAEALKKYKELLDAGAITPEEYEAKKAELLK